MKHRLITQLVLPLAVATAAAIFVHTRWPADGFFMNLAAGFVGSLVTVGYVDWILRRHERDRWRETDSRIASRLSQLAAATITGLRTSFGYGTDIFDTRAMASGDSDLMHSEVLRIASDVLAPTANVRVVALDSAGWKRFATHLQQMSAECGVLMDRFGHRLQPQTIATLLDLQQVLESAQTFWRVFPDVAGVPFSQLPVTKTPPGELQAAWCELTADDVRKVLKFSAQLSKEAYDT